MTERDQTHTLKNKGSKKSQMPQKILFWFLVEPEFKINNFFNLKFYYFKNNPSLYT